MVKKKNLIIKIYFVLQFVLITGCSVPVQNEGKGTKDSLAIIEHRLKEDIWKRGSRYGEPDLTEEPVYKDGYYYLSSVDYLSSKSSSWEPLKHLV